MKNEYAFPSAPESGLGSTGMTMRDVFAAAALAYVTPRQVKDAVEADTRKAHEEYTDRIKAREMVLRGLHSSFTAADALAIQHRAAITEERALAGLAGRIADAMLAERVDGPLFQEQGR